MNLRHRFEARRPADPARNPRQRTVPGMLVVALAVAGVAVSTSARARPATASGVTPGDPRTTCTSGWQVQRRSGTPGALVAVAAAGAGDAWAVGSVGFGVPTRTLAMRWDGADWTVVASPNPSSMLDVLNGVAVLSARDAWAVGGAGAMSGITLSSLIEHWNGTGWTVVRARGPQELEAVVALSPSDIWAVGNSNVTSAAGPATTSSMHWTGTRWVSVPTVDPGAFNALSTLARIPRTDQLWAGGSTTARSGGTGPAGINPTPLIERWTGTRWTVVATPDIHGQVLGIAATGPADAWAVGEKDGAGGRIVPLVLHWNGQRWAQLPLPSPKAGLTAVVAPSVDDVWAVGNGTILHFDGTSWRTSPWPSPSGATLDGIGQARGSVWAVGWWDAAQPRPLVVASCS